MYVLHRNFYIVWYTEWYTDCVVYWCKGRVVYHCQWNTIALPWYAYAIARMKEKEGALADAAYWDAKHEAGCDEFVQWATDNCQQLTPPYYSNRPLPPYFLRGSTSVLVVAQTPTMSGN